MVEKERSLSGESARGGGLDIYQLFATSAKIWTWSSDLELWGHQLACWTTQSMLCVLPNSPRDLIPGMFLFVCLFIYLFVCWSKIDGWESVETLARSLTVSAVYKLYYSFFPLQNLFAWITGLEQTCWNNVLKCSAKPIRAWRDGFTSSLSVIFLVEVRKRPPEWKSGKHPGKIWVSVFLALRKAIGNMMMVWDNMASLSNATKYD